MRLKLPQIDNTVFITIAFLGVLAALILPLLLYVFTTNKTLPHFNASDAVVNSPAAFDIGSDSVVEARNSRRLTDLNEVKKALDLAVAETAVPSVPFPKDARGNSCTDPASVDGNGWVKLSRTGGVELKKYLAVLPMDPSAPNGCYYFISSQDGMRYKVMTQLENAGDATVTMANDGGIEEFMYEVGSDLAVPVVVPTPTLLPTLKASPVTLQNSCKPRPFCLDSTPKCTVAVPAGGWCTKLDSVNVTSYDEGIQYCITNPYGGDCPKFCDGLHGSRGTQTCTAVCSYPQNKAVSYCQQI